MLGTLVPCGGGAAIALLRTPLVVGRYPECDIVVPCNTVSGRHCELGFADGAWSVRDLGSKNGVRVNGVRCKEQHLTANDVLAFGKQRFMITFEAAEAKPAPAMGDIDLDALVFEMLERKDDPVQVPAAAQHQPDRPPAAPNLQARPDLGSLVPCGGGDPIPLLMTDLIIGRHPECDIRLPFPVVSSRHCKMSWRDGYWFVEDLKSSNGTCVNGQRCRKKCLLPQNVLGVAKHRYIVHYTPAGAGPPPEVEEDIFSQGLLEKAGLAKQFGGPSQPAPAEPEPGERVRYRLDEGEI